MSSTVKYLMCLCLFVVLGATEDEAVTDMSTQTDPDPDLEAELSDVVCNICACDGGAIDCSGRKLRAPFSLADWEGLKPHNPTKVDLSSNRIESITAIAELPIQHLNISDCQIEHIDDYSFRNLAELVSLDLSRNMISTNLLSRRTFGSLRVPGEPPFLFYNMRFLSLAYNDIYSLPQDVFLPVPSLAVLDLSGNPLAFIDQLTMAAISELTKLKELKLNSCELEALPEGLLRRLRRLERLELSDNRFTAPPAALAEAANLLVLHFNKNPVVTLAENTSISSLKKLKELRLCRLSKLQSISAGSLGGLQSLLALRVCYNPRLTTVDPAFLMWTDEHGVERYPLLDTFYLNNNNLSAIDSHFVSRWDRLADVDFSNNPYQCDCRAQWMLNVLTPLIAATTSNETAADMLCSKPHELRGLSFAKLRALGKTLACSEPQPVSGAPPPDAAIILGIMIGIFVTFPLVLVVVLLWRRGYFTRCRRNINREREKHYYDEDEVL